MKTLSFISAAALSVFLANADASKANGSFTPRRLSYADLNGSASSLLDALEESSGIVSLTNLPENFASIKKDVMSHLHSCLLDQQRAQANSEAPSVAEETFGDGTVRRTLATATTSLEGPLGVKLDGKSASASCVGFEKNLAKFRSIADKATTAFATALSREMEPFLSKPLLQKKNDDNESYNTILDLVQNGEQLEHFHSYQKLNEVGEEYNDDAETSKMSTIDLHADQGFFIAFTPGMMTGSNAANGFYIVEEEDGSENNVPVHVNFDAEQDELVFMLGDGVNQYVNNRLVKDGRRALRATPHAVSLKYHDESEARVWYGRMVLPPNDALVAVEDGSIQTTLTHGDVRRRLSNTPASQIAAGLGCSSPTARALQHSGNHDEPDMCEKGQLFCWARCMELSDYEITEEMCAEQGLPVQCINPRGQFSTGERHGDFWPACSNTTKETTPYPEIPQADLSVCTADAFQSFVEDTGDVTYDHSFDLTNTEKGNSTVLQWSVVDEEKGIVRGRLVFGDVFGWLSIGFADPEGKHNGMNGGDIILALPGGNWTAMYGLKVPGLTITPNSDEITTAVQKNAPLTIESDVNPPESTVHEYQIDHDGSSFRHWSEPGKSNDGQNAVVVNDCFTALTFESDNINGHVFTVGDDVEDDMIWGGNSKDYHVGYHGRGNRARFYINWKTGEGRMWVEPEEEEVEEDDHDEHDHDHDHDDGDMEKDSSGPIAGSIVAMTVGLVASIFAL